MHCKQGVPGNDDASKAASLPKAAGVAAPLVPTMQLDLDRTQQLAA